MGTVRHRRSFRVAIACCALALTLGSEVASAAIVVTATGPAARLYSAGRKIPDGSTLTLPANASVTLLHPHGTQRLVGPGTFTVGASDATVTNVGFMASAGGPPRRRIGAVRGPSQPVGIVTTPERKMDMVKIQVEAGHFDTALRLVADLERDTSGDRIECHTVRNLHLYTLVAAGRSADARTLPDSCGQRPLPDAEEAIDRQLVIGGEQIVDAGQ